MDNLPYRPNERKSIAQNGWQLQIAVKTEMYKNKIVAEYNQL